MKKTPEPEAAASLERLFHEPSRMAILSALCAGSGDLSFSELKAATALTDGNLSRHLKALEEAGVVRLRKTFVGVKPRTTVTLTEKGLKRFDDYLRALADVLDKARQALPARSSRAEILPALGRRAPA